MGDDGRSTKGGAQLDAMVDGVAVPEATARELWRKFSAYMEEHRGDLGGFAQAEGFVSVHPRSEGGRAVLVLSRTAMQEPYGSVAKVAAPPTAKSSGGGGSGPRKRRRR